MTLKKKFIKEFGKINKTVIYSHNKRRFLSFNNKHWCTEDGSLEPMLDNYFIQVSEKTPHGLSLAKIKNKIVIIDLKKKQLISSFISCIPVSIYDDEMKFNKIYYYLPSLDIKINNLCKEIEIRNLEKQILEETKHLPTIKKKLQKF